VQSSGRIVLDERMAWPIEWCAYAILHFSVDPALQFRNGEANEPHLSYFVEFLSSEQSASSNIDQERQPGDGTAAAFAETGGPAMEKYAKENSNGNAKKQP
jgi:hypothetical protein